MNLRELHLEAEAARIEANAAATRFHRAVADALSDGRSAAEIADTLGVSRGRVYQWRRKAE